MKFVITILLLWLIAIASTLILVEDHGRLKMLLPVLGVCMIGSVVTVRRAAGPAGNDRSGASR